MPLTKICFGTKSPSLDKSIGVEEIEIKDYLARVAFRQGRKHNNNGILYF